LPSNLEIGQGEIINENSIDHPTPDEYRNQVDLVLYRRDLPKINYGGGNTAYLYEGVLATIEVKSILTKEELEKACRACVTHKNLKYRDSGVSGILIERPREIDAYVVAFEGPAEMNTVAVWMKAIRQKFDVAANLLPAMIVILGKGTLWNISSFERLRGLKYDKDVHSWAHIQQKEGNLLLLFVHMLSWMGPPSVLNYAKGTALRDVVVT
jgi:hypothetical protein